MQREDFVAWKSTIANFHRGLEKLKRRQNTLVTQQNITQPRTENEIQHVIANKRRCEYFLYKDFTHLIWGLSNMSDNVTKKEWVSMIPCLAKWLQNIVVYIIGSIMFYYKKFNLFSSPFVNDKTIFYDFIWFTSEPKKEHFSRQNMHILIVELSCYWHTDFEYKNK